MLQRRFSNGVEILSIDVNKLMQELKEITCKMKKGKKEVKKVILFGSFSKGNFSPQSDLDIAIIVSDSQKSFLLRGDDYIDYFLGLGIDVNLLLLRDRNLIYPHHSFVLLSHIGNIFKLLKVL